jgi:hypothetical protein
MKVSKTERDQQLEQLRKWLKPGDTVYTIVENVSRSGMSREIRVVLLKCQETGEAYSLHPNHAVSTVLGLPRGKREGVKIQGCGMDMGFEIVYQLGMAMWPHGTPEPHGERNGEPDSNGGYALKHRWL